MSAVYERSVNEKKKKKPTDSNKTSFAFLFCIGAARDCRSEKHETDSIWCEIDAS